MSADDRAVSPSVAAQHVAVIVALGLERASLTRGLAGDAFRQIAVHQSGPGPQRAARAAAAALEAGAAGVVSWGLAGGLDPALAPGTVVLPRVVRAPNGADHVADEAWRGAALRALRVELPVSEGDLLGVETALLTREAKAAAAACGAVAADMESAAIAAIAARAGAPFIALRVVVDTAADALPIDAEGWIDELGHRRAGAALAAALQPSQWRVLWTLAGRYRAARRALDRAAALAVAHRFLANPLAASRAD